MMRLSVQSIAMILTRVAVITIEARLGVDLGDILCSHGDGYRGRTFLLNPPDHYLTI